MHEMFNFFHRRSSKTSSRDLDFFARMHNRHPAPRNSSERHALNPLLDEEGTDETRYYRSAEFQQALLEDQIERSLTTPIEEPETQEEAGRMSRFLQRRSTAASKSSLSLSLPFFDQDIERARQERRDRTREEDGDVSPLTYDNEVPSISHDPESTAMSSDGSASSEPSRSSSRPTIHRNDGIGPLISFARNKRE